MSEHSDSYELGILDIDLTTLSGDFRNLTRHKTTEYTREEAFKEGNAADAPMLWLMRLSYNGWRIVHMDVTELKFLVTMQRRCE